MRVLDEWVYSEKLLVDGTTEVKCWRDGVDIVATNIDGDAALLECRALVRKFDRARKTIELPAVVLP